MVIIWPNFQARKRLDLRIRHDTVCRRTQQFRCLSFRVHLYHVHSSYLGPWDLDTLWSWMKIMRWVSEALRGSLVGDWGSETRSERRLPLLSVGRWNNLVCGLIGSQCYWLTIGLASHTTPKPGFRSIYVSDIDYCRSNQSWYHCMCGFHPSCKLRSRVVLFSVNWSGFYFIGSDIYPQKS